MNGFFTACIFVVETSIFIYLMILQWRFVDLDKHSHDWDEAAKFWDDANSLLQGIMFIILAIILVTANFRMIY